MRLELEDKFWEIVLGARSFTIATGRIGTAGQTKKQTFKTGIEARQKHNRLVADKLAKGFRDPAALPALPASTAIRNPELEAAIRADRAEPGAYQVYADWLQGQGNPMGELIVLQQALDKKKADAKKRKRADAIIAELGLPGDDLATVGWRWGMWSWLRLENSVDWMNTTFDALGFARAMFAAAPCAALDELRIGILRWDFNHQDVPAVLGEAGKHAWAADLRRLHLGDVSSDIDMAHHMIGVVGPAISKSFPRLASLKLHSGDQSWRDPKTFVIGKLDLPELTELVIETCAMSKQRLADVLAAKLPALERLELWFGSANEGANAKLEHLRPLLDGKVFPEIRHLGLRNAEFEDELARTIHASPIASRLETLDLSMGTMDDASALELARNARRFTRLVSINVDDNFLSATGISVLRGAFGAKRLVSGEQREPYDDGERYVSVGE